MHGAMSKTKVRGANPGIDDAALADTTVAFTLVVESKVGSVDETKRRPNVETFAVSPDLHTC